jgi:hypothetical protein
MIGADDPGVGGDVRGQGTQDDPDHEADVEMQKGGQERQPVPAPLEIAKVFHLQSLLS